MSKAVSALMGATFQGFCAVEEAGLVGMITLRGDLKADTLAKALKGAVGCAVPAARRVDVGKKGTAAWMSPDELLLIVDYDGAQAIEQTLSKALASTHAMVVNVSDARAVFQVKGSGARDVIAKLSPADVSPTAFGPGEMRRTRLAQVAGAFHMLDEETFQIVCFRSVADYVFGLLTDASKPGAEVGHLG